MKKYMRLLVFILGIFILALGIVLSDMAGLGISPPSALPYALNYVIEIGVGKYFSIVGIIYIALQIIILRKDFEKRQILQVFFGVILGWFIDFITFFMSALPSESLLLIALYTILSINLIALGVALTIVANVVYPSLEGLQKAISDKYDIEFSKVKVFIDVIHLIVSLVLSLVYTSSFGVIGINTFIQAFFTGVLVQYFIKVINRKFKKVK